MIEDPLVFDNGQPGPPGIRVEYSDSGMSQMMPVAGCTVMKVVGPVAVIFRDDRSDLGTLPESLSTVHF